MYFDLYLTAIIVRMATKLIPMAASSMDHY